LIKIVNNKKVVHVLESSDHAILRREDHQKVKHKNKGEPMKALKEVKALPMAQVNTSMITKKCKLTIRSKWSMLFPQ
jgi:hypothetical protein